MIRAVLALLAGLFAAAPALAGDIAERAILGFSPEGSVFAFEEYGVQDGSGFPYSTVYFIDTTRDAWLPDTPVRVVLEDENQTLDAARAKAAALAAPHIARHLIAPVGRIVASNPSSEIPPDPHSIRFLADLYSIWRDNTFTATVETYPIAAPDCDRLDLGESLGYRLKLADWKGGVRILNEDKVIPASRGCPQDYRIADVITFFPKNRQPVMVILLHLVALGFEGPDYRFLAVATRFDDF